MQQIVIELVCAGPVNVYVTDEAADAYWRLRALAAEQRVGAIVKAAPIQPAADNVRPLGWQTWVSMCPMGLADESLRVGDLVAGHTDANGHAWTLTRTLNLLLVGMDADAILEEYQAAAAMAV